MAEKNKNSKAKSVLTNTQLAQQAAAGNRASNVKNENVTLPDYEQQQLNFLRNIAGMQEGSLNNFESRFIDYRPFRESLTGQGSQEELRQLQRNQLARFTDRAEGNAPSLAQAQLREAQDRSLAQQLANTQAGRGGNQTLALRNALNAQAANSSNLNTSGAELMLKERQMAEEALTKELSDQRAQDIALQQSDLEARRRLATQNAQFANKMAIRDQQAAQAAKDRKANQMAGIGSAAGAILGSTFGPAGTAVGATVGSEAGKAVGKLISDKKGKKNIKKADKGTEKFLDALQSYTYDYKNKKDGLGKHLGIMAQSLQKSKIGKGMVEEVDGSLIVNPAKGFGAILAAQANINKRLKTLENKKKYKK